jgi:hypothetical protein
LIYFRIEQEDGGLGRSWSPSFEEFEREHFGRKI